MQDDFVTRIKATSAFLAKEGPHGDAILLPRDATNSDEYDEFVRETYTLSYLAPGPDRVGPMHEIADLTLRYNRALVERARHEAEGTPGAASGDAARLEGLRARVRHWAYRYTRNRWSDADHRAERTGDAIILTFVYQKTTHYMALVGVDYNPLDDPYGFGGDVALLLRPLMFSRNNNEAPRLVEFGPEDTLNTPVGERPNRRVVYPDWTFRAEDPEVTGTGQRRVVRTTLLSPAIVFAAYWVRATGARMNEAASENSFIAERLRTYREVLDYYRGLVEASQSATADAMRAATRFNAFQHVEAGGVANVAVYGTDTSVAVDRPAPDAPALGYTGHVSYIYSASLPVGYKRVREIVPMIPRLDRQEGTPSNYLEAMLPLSAPTPEGDRNLPAVYFDMLFEYAVPRTMAKGIDDQELQNAGNWMHNKVIVTRQTSGDALRRIIRAMAYVWTYRLPAPALAIEGLTANESVPLVRGRRVRERAAALYTTYVKELVPDVAPHALVTAPPYTVPASPVRPSPPPSVRPSPPPSVQPSPEPPLQPSLAPPSVKQSPDPSFPSSLPSLEGGEEEEEEEEEMGGGEMGLGGEGIITEEPEEAPEEAPEGGVAAEPEVVEVGPEVAPTPPQTPPGASPVEEIRTPPRTREEAFSAWDQVMDFFGEVLADQNAVEDPATPDSDQVRRYRALAPTAWNALLHDVDTRAIRGGDPHPHQNLRLTFWVPQRQDLTRRTYSGDPDTVDVEIASPRQILGSLDMFAEERFMTGARRLPDETERMYGWVSGTHRLGKRLPPVGGVLSVHTEGYREPLPATEVEIPRAGLLAFEFWSPGSPERVQYNYAPRGAFVYGTAVAKDGPEFSGQIFLSDGNRVIGPIGYLGGLAAGGKRYLRYIIVQTAGLDPVREQAL